MAYTEATYECHECGQTLDAKRYILPNGNVARHPVQGEIHSCIRTGEPWDAPCLIGDNCEKCARILAISFPDFHNYQRVSYATRKHFDNPDVNALYFPLGLCGEAGEVAEMIKKNVRDDSPLDLEKLKKELGDVLWYLNAIASLHGIKLADVASANVEKLSRRYPKGAYKREDAVTREREK